MSNHSSEMDPEMADRMRSFLRSTQPIGPTGEFPEGKLTEKDEGAVVFAVGVEQGKVVIQFDTPMSWLGMLPDQALQLANILRTRALEAQVLSKF